MSDDTRRRRDQSRLRDEDDRDDLVVISPQVEQPDPENPHRMSYTPHHAVKYLLTDEGWLIDPDQTITEEVDTTTPPEPGPEPEPGPTAPPVNIDVPLLLGPDGNATASVGQILNCTMGNWQGEPTSYDYAWYRDDYVVGMHGTTHQVVPDDVGCSIRCVVTASNALGSTTAPPSNAIAVA